VEDEKDALGLAIMNIENVFQVNPQVKEKLKINITHEKLVKKLLNFL